MKSKIIRSSRVIQVESMFDVPPSQRAALSWEVDLPIDDVDWNIGLIVGPSGCGKTTIARELFGKALARRFTWDKNRSVLDSFPKRLGIKQIVGLLTAVGFGTPPAWLRPFHVLSNGEQFRASVARALAETDGLVVIDEFTSVVDRQVAKVASHAVQKAVRRQKRRLIAVSCHYDIIDWLQPDWVYQPQTRGFARRSLQPHPPLELAIHPVDKACWEVFKHHHYMSGRLLSSAQCVGGFLDGQCIGFAAWRHAPHFKVRNLKVGHRLVVLPDFQGLGIGGRIDDWIGQHLYESGCRYRNVIAHPAMIAYYNKSPRWRLIRQPANLMRPPGHSLRTGRRDEALRLNHVNRSIRRSTATFEYVPPR